MAISKQLKDEADRTIAGITEYFRTHGDSIADSAEMEHRIGKVTAALEGCNGLTEKEKIQKTAENLFGLTCSWERDSLAIRRELHLNRETTTSEFGKSKRESEAAFKALGDRLASVSSKMDGVFKEVDRAMRAVVDSQAKSGSPAGAGCQDGRETGLHHKILSMVDRHFTGAVVLIISVVVVLAATSNLETIIGLFNK